jgi:DNA-3-methyladenine glycosylase II
MFTPTELSKLSRADKTIGKLIREHGPIAITLPKRQSIFQGLGESIIFQQISGKAAQSILRKFCALYPRAKFPTSRQLLETPDETLRSAGISRSKALALKDLATKTVEGVVPTRRRIESMSDEEVIEALTQVRGIGAWTVQMLLIFQLGRKDVLPVTDYGVRKGFSIAYGLKELPTPKQLLLVGERWAPYRTAAAWYCWRAIDGAAKKPDERRKK